MFKRLLFIVVILFMAQIMITSITPAFGYMYKVSRTAMCNLKQVTWCQMNKEQKRVKVWFGATDDTNMVEWKFDTLTETEKFYRNFVQKCIDVNGGDY